MNVGPTSVVISGALSEAAKERLLSHKGEPLFVAAWDRVLMIHFEVDAEALQRDVPYELDLRDGRAFISLVAFTMRGMRPFIGGKYSEWLFKPIATHDFLNVRTYVRNGNETGIHFLAEWLSNWLSVQLGPMAFGLPYQHGRTSYHHNWQRGTINGRVVDVKTNSRFHYAATLPEHADFAPCEGGSLDEWLMERYTAFNSARGSRKFFRIWHPPWFQCQVDVHEYDVTMLKEKWRWLADAHLVGANFSPGLDDVWMGRPHRIVR
jgi:uncharacterized protein YqjF (DUF2071 family)